MWQRHGVPDINSVTPNSEFQSPAASDAQIGNFSLNLSQHDSAPRELADRELPDRDFAQRELHRAMEVYQQLIDESSDGMIVVNPANMQISQANQSACLLLGYTRNELIGLATSELVLREDIPVLLETLERVDAGKRVEEMRRLRRKDGSLVWCDVTTKALPDGYRQSIVRNVTERVRLEEERASILERITDGFIALDADGRFTWVNEQAAATFDRVPQDMIGKNIWEEFGDTISQPLLEACERVMRTQVPTRIEDFYAPHERWYEDRIFPSKTGLSIFFSDITERKNAERELQGSADQLRRLTQRLNDVREQEQADLSRELHDRLGHSLTMLKLGLSRFTKLAQPDADSALDQVQQLNAEIDSAIDTTRKLSSELRPPMLDDFGLAAALEWAGKRFTARTGIGCRLELDDCSADKRIARALFAISQEAFTNIVRHAGATTVTLRLRQQDGEVCLEIEDNGVGIQNLDNANRVGLGLLGMRERASAVGAKINILPGTSQGTRIIVRAASGESA